MRGRPLSPHLQIYRPQLTSVLSILHRLTGLALVAGTGLLVYWLWSAAAGEAAYACAQLLIGSWLGRLVLFGWSFSLFYHFSNGLRHLLWDTGRGLSLPVARAAGWAVVVLSVALTLGAWIAGYAMRGGGV